MNFSNIMNQIILSKKKRNQIINSYDTVLKFMDLLKTSNNIDRDETQTHGLSSCVTPTALQRKDTHEPFYFYETKKGVGGGIREGHV